MFNIAICDDEKRIFDEIDFLLLKTSKELGLDINIEHYHSGDRLISAIKNKEEYDLIYMDIEMDGHNGIHTSKIIREIGINSIIIFISSYEKYLIELFEVEPFRFIKKPIIDSDFEEFFAKAIDKLSKQNVYFEYSVKKNMKKILFKDIIYLESSQRQIIVHKNNGKDIFYGKLNDLENKIKQKSMQFIRIHQSYFVNYNYIESFEVNCVKLFNGDILNISEDRKKDAQLHYFHLIDFELFK